MNKEYLDFIYTKDYIIFDMDGTLIDTEPLHIKAWNHLAESYSYPKFDEDFIQIVGGRPTLEIAKKLLQDTNQDVALAQELCEKKTTTYREMFLPEAELFPPMLELLQDLKQRGKKIALATGSYQRETLMLLDKCGIKDLFDAIVTSDNIKRPKPNPDIYLKALELISGNTLSLDKALVFEDTKLGLEGVKNAKIDCFLVSRGSIVKGPIHP